MPDYKARRLAGEQVCLTCGHYSSAMTCSLCVQRATVLSDDIQYFHDQIARALQIPKEYLSTPVVPNPMTVEEDYWLPVKTKKSCSRCGFETCACEALGYSDEPSVDCTLSHLAQAIFDTDPEVLTFIELVGEVKHAKDPMVAKKRALDVAWERDEHGWATRARERAAAIKGAL